MISDHKKDKALIYLAETDEPAAKAKTLVKALEDQKKPLLANLYLDAEGSQGDRVKKAEAHPDYQEHLQKLNDARYEFEHMNEKRNTAKIILDIWRSENSNRRVGHV